jgi:hypothetical protein
MSGTDSTPDVERIRREEILREEIAKTLKKPQSRKEQVWSFFNSNLGLFLLSSILLSGLTYGFTEHTQKLAQQRQMDETIQKLDLEIAKRVSYLPGVLKVQFSWTDLQTLKKAVLGKLKIRPGVETVGDSDAIFPEYNSRTLPSLLWELKRLAPASEQEGIAHAIEVTKKLPALLDDNDPNAMKLLKPYGDEDSQWCLTPEAKGTLQTQVLPAFQLDRWKY